MHRQRSPAYETGDAAGGRCGDHGIQLADSDNEVCQSEDENPISGKGDLLLYRVSMVQGVFSSVNYTKEIHR